MVNGDTKRIVVIKDINSDTIEEAILILKNECDIVNSKEKGDILRNKREKDKEYLLREAQSIIENYMKKCNIHPARTGHGKIKRGSFKRTSINTILNLVLLAGIMLVVFVVIKLL